MTRPGRYPQELRERAVRMVFEHREEHHSQLAAITSIASKFGVSAETLRKWVRRTEVDDGLRPRLTTEEREWLKALAITRAVLLGRDQDPSVPLLPD